MQQRAREAEQVNRSMGQQTWAGAIGDVWRTAVRHKVISGLIALCVAGSLVAIGVAGSASGASGQPAKAAATSRRPRSASRSSAIPASTSRSASTRADRSS